MFSQVLLDNISQRISRSIYHSFPHFTCTMFCFMFKILSRGFGNKYLTTQNLIMVLMYFLLYFLMRRFPDCLITKKPGGKKTFLPEAHERVFPFQYFTNFPSSVQTTNIEHEEPSEKTYFRKANGNKK